MSMPVAPVGYAPVRTPEPLDAVRSDQRVIETQPSDDSNSASSRRQPPEGMGRHVDKRA
ncbi:MAG: hypothetical protein ABTQ29_01785 [Siculibacillus sp.]